MVGNSFWALQIDEAYQVAESRGVEWGLLKALLLIAEILIERLPATDR